MSGHSKWNNIKRKKEKTDAGKAKTFTRVGREIAVAVREGGADPTVNFRLRDVIAKAKANNVPNDNIERIIKKASGEDADKKYEIIIYEGYGTGGVAVIVETLTDNRNRTAADVRHAFDKFGAGLGNSGSVMFQFSRRGLICIDADGLNEETVMNDAIECGADDFAENDGIYEIITEPAKFISICFALTEKGYTFTSADIEYHPDTYAEPDEAAVIKTEKLLDMLDDNDDVQNVWHNLL